MRTFDDTIAYLTLYLEQAEGALILVGVCDDTVLRAHTVKTLRQHLPADVTLYDFHYDAEHLSLLEGTAEVTAVCHGRCAVSVTGLETLTRDKRTEAIRLLNIERNRFGHTAVAVILWVNRAILADISTMAADFYSWRSTTFFVEPPPAWDTLASIRTSYLDALAAQHEFVNLQGLAPRRGGQIVQMRMEDIFIPLCAEQEVKTVDPALGVLGRWRLEVEQEDETPMPQAEAERALREARYEVRQRRLEMPELFRERRAVVLGDPGAGKTTLLRYVAYTLARAHGTAQQADLVQHAPDLVDALPVYVRIGEYAQHLQEHPETSIERFAPMASQMRQLPLTDALLQDAMARGRALFLLDGLDEILDTTQRREIAQRIEHFARLHPQYRMLVTSRIVGYREAQLGDAFGQFTISPFAEADIHHFVQRWYTALGMPDGDARLVEAIQAHPSMRHLASNPLLLTVVALMHWRGGKLPHRRVTLYRLAAETLVDQWMSHRRVSPEGWDAQETLQVLLPAVAWHLHHTTSSGLIGQEALQRVLVDTLQRHNPHLGKREAHVRATQFRRNVSEFSGIFLERGLDRDDRGLYGFLHLMFEEYFAALHLADQWQRDGEHVLQPLLHDPRWDEILLLTAGHFGETNQYQATRFVQAILGMHSPYEDILHRDLLMAVRCLADDVRVDPEVRRTIFSQLLKVYFAATSPIALQEDIRAAGARLSGATAGIELVQRYVKRLTSRRTTSRKAAAEALGQMGSAAATPEVLGALLPMLTDPEWNIRLLAATTLRQLGSAAVTPEVLRALLHALADPEWFVRRAAAEVLGQLGSAAATPEVLRALLHALTDPEWNIRLLAAEVLGRLGATATPEVLRALLHALTDPKWNVHRAAAEALGQMGSAAATPEVLRTLLPMLTDPEEHVRLLAATTLGQLGSAAVTPEVLRALLHALADPEWFVRRTATEALGRLGATAATPEVLRALLHALADPKWNVRRAAAEALGRLGATATPEVLRTLLHMLTNPEEHVRRLAVGALGQLGSAAVTPEVLRALLHALADPEWNIRLLAAEVLGRLGATATPEVLRTLLHMLTDPTEYVRRIAAEALGWLGAAATPEVLRALLHALTDPNWDVRRAVAEALGQLTSYTRVTDWSTMVELLLPAAHSRNAEDRNVGYVSLRNLLAGEPSVIEESSALASVHA